MRLLISMLTVFAAFALAADLTIAAGAGYKKPLTEAIGVYEKKTGQTVEGVFGNMAQVMAQVKQTGQIPLVVGEKGFLAKSDLGFQSYTDLGKGILVLAWPKGAKPIAKIDDLKNDRLKRIAIPDATKAIYGKAGTEALMSAGLSDVVKERLIVTATVPQASAYLVAGEVDAGFINLTDALGIADKIGGFIRVDPSLYKPIDIAAATLECKGECRSFLEFLKGEEARKIFAAYGLE